MIMIGWVLVILLFGVGMVGTVYPVLPGALAIYAAFFVYGLFISFAPFGFWFWFMQTATVVIIFITDYMISALGTKKFGGSRASVIGGMLGLIIGAFFFPIGLIIGPFVGAFLGELIHGADITKAAKAGLGSVVGFFSSVAAKIVLQLIMIILFFVWI